MVARNLEHRLLCWLAAEMAKARAGEACDVPAIAEAWVKVMTAPRPKPTHPRIRPRALVAHQSVREFLAGYISPWEARADNAAQRSDCCGRLSLLLERTSAGGEDFRICASGRGCRR